jgi:2-oxoisovalerate dehydrogenase E2 component (dihydrolipoyl transacylase)
MRSFRFVKPGDRIEQFSRICEVQSDKAAVEITSRFDGVVSKLLYQPGEMALVGHPLVEIDTDAEGEQSSPAINKPVDDASSPATSKATSDHSTKITPPAAAIDSPSNAQVLATPAVRRVARENMIDLEKVKGTGKGGRILKEDVLNFKSVESEPTGRLLRNIYYCSP